MSTATRRAVRRTIALSVCAALALALVSALAAGDAAAAARRCSPVVTGAGPGFTQATVLVVTGRSDCERSRKVIFRALSTAPFEDRQIEGWSCSSTARGGSGVYGARCTTEGEKGEEVIKSTTPARCPGCHKERD